MPEYNFIPLEFRERLPAEIAERAQDFFEIMRTRRSVREFSPASVPMQAIEFAVRTAGSAPSGANKQPWFFAVITDSEIKSKIRYAAEAEERINYGERFTQEWLEALKPLGTDEHKEFLESAPVLIVIFKQTSRIEQNRQRKNYYVNESVGLSMGLLISALHYAGLATLTYTPSSMKFLNKILERPSNETPVAIIPVGYPNEGATVPDISRKPIKEIMKVY
jgi:iodotyrosine deiodinase